MDAEARRKAAAEARRAKVLARGGDRLARITGSLPEAEGAPSASLQQQPSQPSQPAAAAAAAATAAAAPAAAAVPATAASPPVAAGWPAPPTDTPAEPPGLRTSASAASLDSQQRAKGTATNSKWARYDSAAPPQQRRLRQVHFGETLSAAVLSTSRLRLLLAALLALLLAVHWDAASAAGAAGSGWAAVQQQQQQRRHGAPLAELAARWQGLVLQAKHAAAPLLGRTPEQAVGAAADKRCRQLWAAYLDPLQARVRDAAATAAALQLPLGTWQRLEASAAAAVAATAGTSCRLYSQAAVRLTAARAAHQGSAWQLAREAAGAAVRQAHAQLEAAATSPLGQQALAYAEAFPPLASLLLLELSLVGAAAAAMAAAPRLVHSALELELQTPGLLARLASFVPGLAQQLSLASGWQRLLTGLLDDAAAFVIALVAYYQLPALLAGGQGGEAAAAA